MKLINQSFEILEQKDFTITGIKKFIERCGRVCYKSEDRITNDSYEKFVNMLVKRDHARPLEFGTVHLKISSGMLFEEFLQDLVDCKLYNPTWIKYKELPEYTYITTNYRHYLQIIEECPYIAKYFTEQDNCYYPSRYTVHMTLSRGIMDEFRTHVGLSHLAESTRYCNYSKDKFDNQITFIQPSWITLDKEIAPINELCLLSGQYDRENPNLRYLASLVDANYAYISLLNKGWTPQQARDVLPLSVKSELISCGFEDVWENFIRRRSPKYGDSGAHPMAAEIANKLGEEFIKRGYIDETKISCRRHPC